MRALLAACALAVVASPATAAADVQCDRFAAPNGSDSADGTAARPFATAQMLADMLNTGQTGCLRQGTYRASSGDYVLRVGHGGTSEAPVTIRSYPGDRAHLVGLTTIPRGSDSVVLSDLEFEGTGSSSTVRISSAGVVLQDSDLTNAGRGNTCLLLGGSDSAAERPTIRRNRFHECGSFANGNKDHGIYASYTLGGEITDNVFHGHSGYAIQLYPSAAGMRVAHNVIDGTGSLRGGIVIGGDLGHASRDNVVENNIVAHTTPYNITSYWGEDEIGSGNVVRNNCLWAGSQGALGPQVGFTAIGNLVVDPLFVDRAAGDYRLSELSPCRTVVAYDTVADVGNIANLPDASVLEPLSAAAVSVVAPLAGARFSSRIHAEALPTGFAAQPWVKFLLDDRPLGVVSEPPYAIDWKVTKKTSYGFHVFKVKAGDATGKVVESSVIVQRVREPKAGAAGHRGRGRRH